MRRFVNLGLCKHRVVTVCREWNRLLHDEHRAFYELTVTAVLSVCVYMRACVYVCVHVVCMPVCYSALHSAALPSRFHQCHEAPRHTAL